LRGSTHKEAGSLIPPWTFAGQFGDQPGNLSNIHHWVLNVHVVKETPDELGDKVDIVE
jgi:hypothetical protein